MKSTTLSIFLDKLGKQKSLAENGILSLASLTEKSAESI